MEGIEEKNSCHLEWRIPIIRFGVDVRHDNCELSAQVLVHNYSVGASSVNIIFILPARNCILIDCSASAIIIIKILLPARGIPR